MPVKKLKTQISKVKTTTQKSKVTKSVMAKEVKQSPKSRSVPVSSKVSLSIPVYSLVGRAAGTLALPKEIFGAEVNKSLLSQSMRVYMTNQKTLPGFTKTRGEVQGSTAKIYRQKGTGRARHGSVRAPIFVGGGIVFGPKPRKVRLELPQRMKKAALISALSAKAKEKQILGISGIEKASGKTKEIAKLMSSVVSRQSLASRSGLEKKQKNINALIVIPEKMDNVAKGTRNIPGVDAMQVNQINAYEVLRHELLLVTKEAVAVMNRKEGNAETRKK